MERKEIKHEKRNFRISKRIEPKDIEGEYNIELRIENIGKDKLENIIITDFIPSSFSMTKFASSKAVTYEIVRVFDISELFIKVSELKSNSSVIINYNLTGSGTYPKTSPPVNILVNN